jgi:hypothetical protein
MHELMNVPESALGQAQPVSNTSGVALSIQFQPLMNRWTHKVAQYKFGLQRVNELVMLNLALKEPEVLTYNPEVNGPIRPGQLEQLDPNDPLTYITYAHFPPPLPLDKLVLLNELAQKISMGLESKHGALRALGEEFPEEKLTEIRTELVDEAKAEGALNLMRVQIQKQIMDMTGMMAGPDGTATPVDPIMMGDGDVLGDGQNGPVDPAQGGDPQVAMQNLEAEVQIREDLLNAAYNTQLPARSTIDKG